MIIPGDRGPRAAASAFQRISSAGPGAHISLVLSSGTSTWRTTHDAVVTYAGSTLHCSLLQCRHLLMDGWSFLTPSCSLCRNIQGSQIRSELTIVVCLLLVLLTSCLPADWGSSRQICQPPDRSSAGPVIEAFVLASANLLFISNPSRTATIVLC